MAELNDPYQTRVNCPHCRSDIYPLLVTHFAAELQQSESSDDDDSSDDDAVSPETLRRYMAVLLARERAAHLPPPPISGVVGDLQWQQQSPPDPRQLGTWPGDRYVFHRSSGLNTLGFFNLASRIHERFHPERGEWRATLQPAGVYYEAAAAVVGIRGRTQQLREWEPEERRTSQRRLGGQATRLDGGRRPSSSSSSRRRRRVVYSFLLEHVLGERTPAVCFVGQVTRQDALHFIYNGSEDRLVYSDADNAEYTGPLQLPPLHQHAHGSMRPC